MSNLRISLPPELKELAGRGDVIFGAPGDQPHVCLNCGGAGIMTAYRIDAGPFLQPSGKGSKYLNHNGRTGWWKGELIAAWCPVCQSDRLQLHLANISGLEGADASVSLEHFRTDGILAGKQPALDIARSYMGMNRRPAGFLTFLGDRETSNGVGKTHLMMGMVNGFRKIGVWSRYTTLADLKSEWAATFGQAATVKTEELMELYQNIRVLAVDEIDKVELAGRDKQLFFRLIDQRHRQQDQLLTILAANAYAEDGRLWVWSYDQFGRPTPVAWPAEQAYLQSRIIGGTIGTLPGPDYRQLQGYARQRAAIEQALEEED